MSDEKQYTAADSIIPGMEKLRDAVREFIQRESMDVLPTDAFGDLTCIGIAEANAAERDNIIIQIAANAEEHTLDQYVNGEKMDSRFYSSIEAMSDAIRCMSFDELLMLSPNAQKRVNELLNRFPKENDFLLGTEDAFALYQLKGGPQYHDLCFAGLDELNRIAMHFREGVQHAVDFAQDWHFTDKTAIEKYLQDEGFSVISNPDAFSVTVSNPAHFVATIHIKDVGDGCVLNGCDTSLCEQPVRHENYTITYTGLLPSHRDEKQDTLTVLDDLYCKFNIHHPKDFYGHSMSVSDVIAIRQNGQINCYYTNSIGFAVVPNFLPQYDYLRNAEVDLEDDFNMVGDGIINNGSKAEQEPSFRSFRDLLQDAKTESSHQSRKQRSIDKTEPAL